MHHGAAIARAGGEQPLQEAVVSGHLDALPARLAELCRYALNLTLRPAAVARADVERLRDEGLTDRDIVDANQVVAYFNYVNRIADGLGVELEDYWPEELRRPRTYSLAKETDR